MAITFDTDIWTPVFPLIVTTENDSFQLTFSYPTLARESYIIQNQEHYYIYVISTQESQYCLNTVAHWDIHSKWGSIRQK